MKKFDIVATFVLVVFGLGGGSMWLHSIGQTADKAWAAEVVQLPKVTVEAISPAKVPVEIGKEDITITLPVVVCDMDVVIQVDTSREKPVKDNGEVAPYSIKVFYPEGWGMPAVQHHLAADGKSAGLYTLTFRREGEFPRSFSFTLNLRNPLSNLDSSSSDLDKERKVGYVAGLSKVFGKDAKNLTLAPNLWLVDWIPYKELNELLEAAPESAAPHEGEKAKPSPQAGGQLPFNLQEVRVPWGEKRGERERLVTLKEIERERLVTLKEMLPHLKGVEASPFGVFLIRVQEGYLELVPGPEWKPSYQIWGEVCLEGIRGQLWHFIKSKSAEGNQPPPSGECYYAAVRRKSAGP